MIDTGLTWNEAIKAFWQANQHLYREDTTMGMFDQVTPFNESGISEGETFTLEAAKIGPAINTEYGISHPAQYKINGKWYSAFGTGLVAQVERLDDNDRRAMAEGRFRTKMVRVPTRTPGQSVKLLVPEDWTPEQGTEDIPF